MDKIKVDSLFILDSTFMKRELKMAWSTNQSWETYLRDLGYNHYAKLLRSKKES